MYIGVRLQTFQQSLCLCKSVSLTGKRRCHVALDPDFYLGQNIDNYGATQAFRETYSLSAFPLLDGVSTNSSFTKCLPRLQSLEDCLPFTKSSCLLGVLPINNSNLEDVLLPWGCHQEEGIRSRP